MAIKTRTFLDKTNTIVYGDNVNLGLNPIMELYYGNVVTRGLIHFDVKKLGELCKKGIYSTGNDKLVHRFKMYNAGGLNDIYCSRKNRYNNSIRAKSFTIVLFEIKKHWDMGGGYDFTNDGYDRLGRIYSSDGSNWYKATNAEPWHISEGDAELVNNSGNGIFTAEYIENHKIAEQHFDVGNEMLDVDITQYVNDKINEYINWDCDNDGDYDTDNTNYGIGIAFSSYYECQINDENCYVGFFTNHTHTFYHPCVETTYDEYIHDDRSDFYLDKSNRLYFYSYVGSKLENLDKIPSCTVNGAEKTVYQASEGIYYIDIYMSSEDYSPETMYYDVWSGIEYKGHNIPDKELYFTTKASDGYFTFGLPYETEKKHEMHPSVYGINNNETIEPGNVMKVNVVNRIPYTVKQTSNVYDIEYKLYAKADGENITVIDWTPVESAYNENYFYVNTSELVPGKYFIGLKMNKGIEEHIYDEMCSFKVNDSRKYINI